MIPAPQAGVFFIRQKHLFLSIMTHIGVSIIKQLW